MRIERMVIENYGSFGGRHEIQLADRGLVLVAGDNQDEPNMDSNGSGKSTLFDALDWGLFGEVPRGDHVDSIVTEGADRCVVEVELSLDDGRQLEVRRSREPGAKKHKTKLLWVLGGEAVKTLDVDETQRRLQRVLGLDRQVFHAAVLFAQEAVWEFAQATDAGRMEIATKVFGLEVLDAMLAMVKARAKEIDQQVQNLEKHEAAGRARYDALYQSSNYAVEAENWERDRRVRVEGAQAWIATASQQVAALPNLRAECERLRETLTPYQMPDDSQYRQAVEDARRAVMQWDSEFKVRMTVAHGIRDRLTKIRGMAGTTCRECNQPVTGDHVQREVMRLEEEYQVAESDVEAARGSLEQWERVVLEYEQTWAKFRTWAEGERDRYEADRMANTRTLATREMEIRELDGVAAKLPGAQAQLLRDQQENNPWEEKAHQQGVELARLEEELSQVTQQMVALRKEQGIWGFWVKGLGGKGLKSYVLDTRLNELTRGTNHWLKLLTGGTLWVRLETQAMGRSTGTLTNKITVRCFRWNSDGTITERGYRSWSGGEKRRFAWALDFGLNQVIASRAAQSYNMMILDEVFKHVDKAGGESIVHMLQGLRAEKDSIYVIEHDSAFKAQFDTQLVAQKKGGRSRILEGKDEEAEAEQGGA